MRICVIGGAGTLGRPLVLALRAGGHLVLSVDKDHSGHSARADVTEFRQIERTLGEAQPDLVFNLAAEFGRNNGEEFYEQCWKTNVVGLRNIMEVQSGLGFKLVHFSSSEIYGDPDFSLLAGLVEGRGLLSVRDSINAGMIHEDLPEIFTPWPMNDYACSKWVNELQIRHRRTRHGNEIMTVRLFNAYGPGEFYTEYRSVICLFVYKLLHGEPITVFDGYSRVFMYIDDLIETLVRIPERFQDGAIINIGGTEFRPVQDVADILLRLTGADPGLIQHQGSDEHNTVDKRPDISRARALLGHAPKVALEEGLPKTVEWVRQTYGL